MEFNIIDLLQQTTANAPINDFTQEQQEFVAQLLEQHFGKTVELQLADSELQLHLPKEDFTICPTLYWSERDAHFVVYKVSENIYRCQYFYAPSEQYGTGIDNYDDLEECVVTLLQSQADHETHL